MVLINSQLKLASDSNTDRVRYMIQLARVMIYSNDSGEREAYSVSSCHIMITRSYYY